MNRSLKAVLSAFILAFVAVAACAAADPATPKRFPLGARGSLQLMVPAGWAGKLEAPPSTAISFGARRGAPFIVSINPLALAAADANTPDREALRQEVERGLASIAPFAVEEKIEVVEIRDAPGPGFYFFATDREPRPGEYKFMTRGALQIGKLPFAFMILTNPGQEQVIREAMAMLRRAAFVQP